MEIMESPFSPQLKMEFMKIETDITRVLHEPEGYNRKFALVIKIVDCCNKRKRKRTQIG